MRVKRNYWGKKKKTSVIALNRNSRRPQTVVNIMTDNNNIGVYYYIKIKISIATKTVNTVCTIGDRKKLSLNLKKNTRREVSSAKRSTEILKFHPMMSNSNKTKWDFTL